MVRQAPKDILWAHAFDAYRLGEKYAHMSPITAMRSVLPD